MKDNYPACSLILLIVISGVLCMLEKYLLFHLSECTNMNGASLSLKEPIVHIKTHIWSLSERLPTWLEEVQIRGILSKGCPKNGKLVGGDGLELEGRKPEASLVHSAFIPQMVIYASLHWSTFLSLTFVLFRAGTMQSKEVDFQNLFVVTRCQSCLL